MSNDPKAAVEWLEEKAAQGEPGEQEPICPMTGTTTCGSGEGCTAC